MEISCFELHKAVNESLSKGRCCYVTRLDQIGVSVSEWLCVFTVQVVYTKMVKLVNCCFVQFAASEVLDMCVCVCVCVHMCARMCVCLSLSFFFPLHLFQCGTF